MPDISYYTSERFIHDAIVEEAEQGLLTLFESWAKRSKISPFVLIWPSEAVAYHGRKTESVLPFDPPENKKEWPFVLHRLVTEYKAYAILLVEQKTVEILVIVESPHGTKSWHIPIRNHGNVQVLDDPVEKTDVDTIGLLWSPARGQA